jgi:hypothetical protein
MAGQRSNAFMMHFVRTIAYTPFGVLSPRDATGLDKPTSRPSNLHLSMLLMGKVELTMAF